MRSWKPAAEEDPHRETTFELLFARNPLPMWVYDVETLRFLEVNEAAIERYGYSRSEFLAMRISDIRPQEDLARLEQNVARLVGQAADGIRRDEQTWRHRLKDGRIRDVEIAAQSLEFDGRVASLVVAIDVTDLQQAQRTLGRYAERLSILHEIDQAIIGGRKPLAIAEPAMRRLRELLQVPRAIVNLFDLDADEAEWLVAVGRQRVHAGPGVRYSMKFMGDVEALRRGELQVLDTAKLPPGTEVEALLKSGVHEYMVVPMIADGELIGGISFGGAPGQFSAEQIGIVREVAAQLAIGIAHARLYERVKHHAEELEHRVHERTLALHVSNEQLQREIVERRRAEVEAERANRLKSEFLANMSHELRTPLNAILGFTELIADGYVTPEAPEYKEFLGDILASGRHLLQLINDVLDLSKIEAGKLDFHAEPVDVPALVAEVLSVLRATASAKAIRLQSEIDPSLIEIALDPARLKQVLYNYVSNALKFTPNGGRVLVSARAENDGSTFRLEVEDSGIGIAPEDIGRLFVEFEQLDGGAAKTHAGTGLGLALTKRLVEAQGGSVGVKSTLGAGSTFHAIFPRSAIAGAARGELRRLDSASDGAPAVLVVEGDEHDQARLVRTLSAAGFAVETAVIGSQALAKCRARPFDAIIIDPLLPDTGGAELLSAIRTACDNARAPVMVITIVNEQGALEGCAVQGVLDEPVDDAELLTSLERSGVGADVARKVLVVDDDAASLRLMASTLARYGYATECVQRAEDGLRFAEASAPLAVVLDLLMPELNGFDFLTRFRRLPACRRVPVIVWTGKDLTTHELLRLRADTRRVIAKGDQGSDAVLAELQTFLPKTRA